MARSILPTCVRCGACEFECPHDAISWEGGETFEIDAERCTECAELDGEEPRCIEACPVHGAISGPGPAAD